MGGLGERALDVRQGQGSEETEPLRVLTADPGAELIDLTRESASLDVGHEVGVHISVGLPPRLPTCVVCWRRYGAAITLSATRAVRGR